MTLRFSPSTRGFYDLAIHGDTIPADAAEISAGTHAEMLEAQAKGQTIDVDETGRPVIASTAPEIMRQQLRGEIKREARRRIDRVAPLWRQLNDLRSDDSTAAHRFAKIDAIRSASDEIERALGDTLDHDLAEFTPLTRAEWPQEPA